jgi:hypothetical protein
MVMKACDVVVALFLWMMSVVGSVVGYDLTLLEALSPPLSSAGGGAAASHHGSTVVRDDDDGFTRMITRPRTLALSSSSSSELLLLHNKKQQQQQVEDGAGGGAGEFINAPLSCHQCHSFNDGPQCSHLAANSTHFQRRCNKTETSCMVLQYNQIIKYASRQLCIIIVAQRSERAGRNFSFCYRTSSRPLMTLIITLHTHTHTHKSDLL